MEDMVSDWQAEIEAIAAELLTPLGWRAQLALGVGVAKRRSTGEAL